MNLISLNDAVIRDVLVQTIALDWQLPRRSIDASGKDIHGYESTLAEEVELGEGYVRADLILCNIERIHVFEIKSDVDTLERLPEQARVYSTIADRVTIVIGLRHLTRALPIVPEWWEVCVAEQTQNGPVALTQLQRSKLNPKPTRASQVKLLSRRTMQRLATELEPSDGLRRKQDLFSFLLEAASAHQIRSAYLSQLRARPRGRRPSFWLWQKELSQQNAWLDLPRIASE